MMGPGASAKVETCLDVIKEVKGWDLQKGAKAFLDAAKKSDAAAQKAGKAVSDLNEEAARIEKRAKSVQGREKRLDQDREKFRQEKAEWAESMRLSGERLEEQRTRNAVAASALKEREDRAQNAMAAADAKASAARDELRKAEKMKADLKPKLDLIAKLSA